MLTAAIVLLLGLTLPTFIPLGSEDPRPEMEIYLLASPIHLDIVVPVRSEVFDWLTFIDPKDYKAAPTEWIEIGWGDKEFYFETPELDDVQLGTSLDALFLPGPGAMHINFLKGKPEDFIEHHKIPVSRTSYRKLVEAIKGSFVLKKGRPVLYPGKAYSESDNFYMGHGTFWFGKTCNVWTSSMLGEAGLKRPLWSPSKYGLQLMWDKD